MKDMLNNKNIHVKYSYYYYFTNSVPWTKQLCKKGKL